MQSMGLLLTTIALVTVVLKAIEERWHWRIFTPRLLALSGEMAYFLSKQNPIGAGFFVVGAVWTVVTWFYSHDNNSHLSGLVEMVELFAWVWIALALR